MEIFEILNQIEQSLTLKDELTESLFKINIELATKKRNHRIALAENLVRFQNQKNSKELAYSKLSEEIYDIEILEEKKMYLYNKLVNTRQELNILSVLLKNEKELM